MNGEPMTPTRFAALVAERDALERRALAAEAAMADYLHNDSLGYQAGYADGRVSADHIVWHLLDANCRSGEAVRVLHDLLKALDRPHDRPPPGALLARLHAALKTLRSIASMWEAGGASRTLLLIACQEARKTLGEDPHAIGP